MNNARIKTIGAWNYLKENLKEYKLVYAMMTILIGLITLLIVNPGWMQ